jgi:hypothetical protein
MPEPVAFVAAPAHTSNTAWCLASARKAERALRTTYVPTFVFYDADATKQRLRAFSKSLRRQGYNVVVGYVAACGSKKGFLGRGEEVIIDRGVLKRMSGAIIVQAPLPDAYLLAEAATKRKGLRVLIGYAPHAARPILNHSMSHAEMIAVKQKWDRCAVQPLLELLNHRAANSAIGSSCIQWMQASLEIGGRKDIALSFVWNALYMKGWGDLSARL